MRRQILAFLAFAMVFGCGTAWTQCNNMAAPVLSDTPVETAQTLKGTGTPLSNGCTASISIWDFATATAAPVQLPIQGTGEVTPDGRFAVTLATGLQGGHMIEVREWLKSTTAPPAKPAKAASAKNASGKPAPSKPAPAEPAPTEPAPQYLSSGRIRVGFCSEQLRIIAVPQLTAPILEGQPTIAGIAGVPTLPGCTAEITLQQAADLAPAHNSVNNSNGTFLITPAAAISGNPIIARENFITPSGTISDSSVSSAPVAIQSCSGALSGPSVPTLTANLLDSATTISGQAGQPTLAGCTAKVRAWRYEIGRPPTLLGESAAVANAAFTIPTLTQPLAVGQQIELQEVILNGAGTVLDPPPACSPLSARTSCVEVHDSEPWGRLKAYFTGGLLLSQDQGSFSQSNLFLAFTLDKTWRLPDYYYGQNRLKPGINTFFETRLTAIPVTSCTQPTAATTTSSSDACTTTSSGSAPMTTPLETFIATRKTARLDVGAYFPWTVVNWVHRGTPNALFIAPLAKTGFDTPVSDVSQSKPASSVAGTVVPANPTNFYTFYAYGGRVGHYSLTSSTSEAPELVSYLDVALGRFSNLETLVQDSKDSTVSDRKRLYRLSLEGILKVPSTPLIIGFSANIGQQTVGVGKSPITQRAGDDLRFLFGTRFEVSKLVDYIAKHGF